MTEERWKQLMDSDNLEISPEEIAQGWHFCWEWDGLLIGPGMGELECCGCLPGELLSELKKQLPKNNSEKVLTEPPW